MSLPSVLTRNTVAVCLYVFFSSALLSASTLFCAMDFGFLNFVEPFPKMKKKLVNLLSPSTFNHTEIFGSIFSGFSHIKAFNLLRECGRSRMPFIHIFFIIFNDF